MLKTIIILISGFLLLAFSDSEKSKEGGYLDNMQIKIPLKKIEEVSYDHVVITDKFWKPKIDKNRLIGIRSALKECASSMDNFDIASGKKKGKHKGNVAGDSDVYKTIQGAAYALSNTPDKELEAMIDSLIDRIVAAQQPDGYLFTYWTVIDISKKWTDLPKKQ